MNIRFLYPTLKKSCLIIFFAFAVCNKLECCQKSNQEITLEDIASILTPFAANAFGMDLAFQNMDQELQEAYYMIYTKLIPTIVVLGGSISAAWANSKLTLPKEIAHGISYTTVVAASTFIASTCGIALRKKIKPLLKS